MGKQFAFVGPYVECQTRDWVMAIPDEKVQVAFDALINDHKRLEWAMPGGNPLSIKVRKAIVYRYCGVPLQRRKGASRWPMLFEVVFPWTKEVLDWSDARPSDEVTWFQSAYGEELELLERVFSSPPVVRWGLLLWER